MKPQDLKIGEMAVASTDTGDRVIITRTAENEVLAQSMVGWYLPLDRISDEDCERTSADTALSQYSETRS